MLKMQIASLLCTQESSISLIFKGTQKQIGSSECGLYAIAFATALMFGQQPGAFFFDEKSLRKHLVDCFQKQRMSIFRYTRTRRNASKVKAMEHIPVYCLCRMPELESSSAKWIQCSNCCEWFHCGKCVDVSPIFMDTSMVWKCSKCSK